MHDEVSQPEGESSRRGFLGSTAGIAGLLLGGASIAQARPLRGKAPTPPRAPTGGGPSGTISATRRKSTRTLPELSQGSNRRQFQQIQADENAHVQLITSALGTAARPRPNFKNLASPDVFTFAQQSFAFENTGVAAYLAAAPIIFDRNILAAAGSILGIEARHAGFLGVLNGQTMDLFSPVDLPAPSQGIILQNVAPYLVDLNGGPPLAFDSTPSAENDINILNFALALEYLERDFYNTNVPKFFA